jgi:hypothetical protein
MSHQGFDKPYVSSARYFATISFDEPSQNHGIRHIGALKFIEAEYSALFSDCCRNERNSVEIVAIFHFHLVKLFVNFLHEIVKMDSRFVFDIMRQSLEE